MSLSCALTALTYINYYKGQQDLNFFQRHNTNEKVHKWMLCPLEKLSNEQKMGIERCIIDIKHYLHIEITTNMVKSACIYKQLIHSQI